MLRSVLAAAALTIAAAPLHAMSGDAEALAWARGMIEQMGGREQWSKTKWVYAREDAWHIARPSPFDAQYWRRADAPEERARSQGPDGAREAAWSASGGHRIRDGKRTEMTPEQLKQVLGWWRGEIYVMYVRFAREDADLRLIKTGERSFRAVDAKDNSNLGEFFVDGGGALYKWRYGFGEFSVEYLYGPLKQFGPVRAPAWGALSDGSFRFFYTDFRLSERGEDIEFATPRRFEKS